MKKEEESLERLLRWARDGAPTTAFILAPAEKAAALASWRREVSGDWNDGLVQFLRWALVSSLAIMALTILFNYQVIFPKSSVKVDHSPQMIFQARVTTDFYLP